MSNGNDDIRIIVATCPETLGTFSSYCPNSRSHWLFNWGGCVSPNELIDKKMPSNQYHLENFTKHIIRLQKAAKIPLVSQAVSLWRLLMHHVKSIVTLVVSVMLLGTDAYAHLGTGSRQKYDYYVIAVQLRNIKLLTE